MIYASFFGFIEEPFGVTPNPRFFFRSKVHEEALAHIKFCISENKGFIILTGEIGSGKTTLMKYFIENLDEKTHTAVILNPKANPIELLKLINRDFGIDCSGNTYDELITCLNEFLISCYSRGEKALIFIDEAQGMSIESLESVRLLSNLETSTAKLLQVVLIGQPELRDIIKNEKLKQLDQRIVIRYHINPLRRDEIAGYIHHRLRKAGSLLIFPKENLKPVFRFSKGIPRLINIACDRILLVAYSEGSIKVTGKIINTALRELGFKTKGLLKYSSAFIILSLVVPVFVYREKIVKASHAFLSEIRLSRITRKNVQKPRFSTNAEGMVMVTDIADARDACFLSLLKHLGEVNLPLSQAAEVITKERGYSILEINNDWERFLKLNLPCIMKIQGNQKDTWTVLLWIISDDAVIFDPLEGSKIIPLGSLKKSASGFVLLWKNKYNSPDNILKLQGVLKEEGFLNISKNGILDKATKEALLKYQKGKGISQTGSLDEETMLVLSRDEYTPGIFPQNNNN